MRSLFARLFSAQLAVVFIALLTVGLSLSYLYTQYIFNLKEQELIRIGQQLARELPTATYPLSLTQLHVLLNAAYVYGDAQIWITNSNGEVLLPQELRGIRLVDEEMEQVFAGKVVSWRSYVEQLGETAFSVAVPINSPLGIRGAVLLHSPLRGIMKTIAGARLFIFWSGILATLLAAIVSLFISKRLADPLREMQVAAGQIAKGDFGNRLQVKGRDEVAELAAAINDMASRLGDTYRALEAEKAQTESVVAGLAEGVVAVDRTGRVHLVNQAAQRLLAPFNLQPGEPLALGNEPPGDWAGNLVAAFREVLASSRPHHLKLDLPQATLAVHISPLKQIPPAAGEVDSAGKGDTVAGPEEELPSGAVALIQDISEAQRLEKMRRDFFADVSHELRTPLTSIRGFAQAILENVVTKKDDVRRYLAVIMNESMRLIRLTNTLLEISRMEANNLKLQLKPVPVREIVEQTLTTIEPLLNEKNISIITDLAADLPPVTVDADRFKQVLINLLDNAIRHTPEEGVIRIAASVAPGNGAADGQRRVELVVTDTGPGIPPEELPYIWERFYKVDKARRQNRSGGTGLGLVIVKQLVELHGGRITVENVPGGGARFVITLPEKGPDKDHGSEG